MHKVKLIILTIIFAFVSKILLAEMPPIVSLNWTKMSYEEHSKVYSTVLARCSALQVTNLRLDDPNYKQKFNVMGDLIKYNSEKFIKYFFQGNSKKDYALIAIKLHEHYVKEYQKSENKHIIELDRGTCDGIIETID